MPGAAIGRLAAATRLAARRLRLAAHGRAEGGPAVAVRRHGLRWELRSDRYVDRAIALGTFEAATVRQLRGLLKPGMHALDVGANIGYFAALMARWTAPDGRVWASEPTALYRERLVRHLALNRLADRVTVLPYGFSDAACERPIAVGICSATLHPPEAEPPPRCATVELRRLDDVAAELGIRRLDVVKADIDGHEPAFLAGARRTLAALRPVIVLEFNQANLEAAGSSADALRRQVEALGYELRSEATGRPFPSRLEFLRECGNYCCSANVWAYPR